MTKQVTAVRKTVKAGRDSGALGVAHEALIGVAVGLAEAVDAAGSEAPAALWKELRAAAEALARAASEVSDGGDSDGVAAVGLPKVGD